MPLSRTAKLFPFLVPSPPFLLDLSLRSFEPIGKLTGAGTDILELLFDRRSLPLEHYHLLCVLIEGLLPALDLAFELLDPRLSLAQLFPQLGDLRFPAAAIRRVAIDSFLFGRPLAEPTLFLICQGLPKLEKLIPQAVEFSEQTFGLPIAVRARPAKAVQTAGDALLDRIIGNVQHLG